MRFDDWEGFHRFPPSQPREAKGGIRASSKRGSFGESWWARRWIQVLESFDIGARLRRGRTYARKGQVLSIDIKKGMVEAAVQGSRPEPYQVTLKVRPLMPSEWKRMAAELSREAIFAAKLLAGEMPQDIERAFTGAGLLLFPESGREIRHKLPRSRVDAIRQTMELAIARQALDSHGRFAAERAPSQGL